MRASLALLLVSCAHVPEAQYQACQAHALAQAEADGQRLCPDSWDECRHRAAIMSKLQADQEACRDRP